MGWLVEKLLLGCQKLANVVDLLKDFLFFVFELFGSSVTNVNPFPVVTFRIKLFGKRYQAKSDRQSYQKHSKDVDQHGKY